MELVEGETLADRVARGAISLDEALPIARQIAEALEAAHEQGIIHRDLKPANIKVTPNGTVKVLDFGLAKLNDSNVPHVANVPNVSNSPTITSPALTTGLGMLLGTAAYMSPEQAKGGTADTRCDVWAFGCVLYEMLTGSRAFAGDQVMDVLASVMARDPDWSRLPRRCSGVLRRLLQRCLDKESHRRISAFSAVLFGLDESAIEQQRPAGGPSRRPASMLWVAAAFAAILITTATPFLWATRTAAAPDVVRFRDVLGEGQVLRGLTKSAIALSRDGKRVIYNTSEGLYLRSLDTLAARLVPGTEAIATNPVFSPDGEWLAFGMGGDLQDAP
jgi:hypothetical protein